MLDTLRRGANTLPAKLLLGLLVLSFGVWGVADVFRANGTRTIATVGDTSIDLTTFQRVYNQQVQTISRQIGQSISPDQAAAFGLPQYVLSLLESDAALADVAGDLGLGLSDDRLAEIIASDPELQVGGTFDRDALVGYLRELGTTEARFVEERRVTELGAQVTDGLLGGLQAPEALVAIAARHDGEERSADVITLHPEPVASIADPPEDVLAAYFEEHKADYAAPEYRKLLLLSLLPEDLARPADVTDEQARAEYQRTIAAYGTPERRTVQQVQFDTREAADAAAARIAAGEATFEAVGAEARLTDLGTLAEADFLDPAVATAAFATPAGSVSPVVEGRFGPVILSVTAIEPAVVRPFEEVAEEVKLAMATVAAADELVTVHDDIENDRIGGSDLAAIADTYGLDLTTVDAVDAGGLDPAGNPAAGLPADVDVVTPAFESEAGLDPDPLPLGREGYLWYEVAETTPARDRTLDEVRADVVAAWKADEVEKRLRDRADALVERIEGGADIASAAIAEGLIVETTGRFTREGEDPLLGRDGILAAFGGPVGHVADAEGPEGTRTVLVVREAIVPPFFAEAAGATTAAAEQAAALEASLSGQLVTNLRTSLGTSINQTLLSAAIGVQAQ